MHCTQAGQSSVLLNLCCHPGHKWDGALGIEKTIDSNSNIKCLVQRYNTFSTYNKNDSALRTENLAARMQPAKAPSTVLVHSHPVL